MHQIAWQMLENDRCLDRNVRINVYLGAVLDCARSRAAGGHCMTVIGRRRPRGPFGVAIASCIGTTIEWFDFYIYSVSAGLVFGPLFFPTGSALASSLTSFATIGVGFLARPVGGLIFSHFGD